MLDWLVVASLGDCPKSDLHFCLQPKPGILGKPRSIKAFIAILMDATEKMGTHTETYIYIFKYTHYICI
jgi:hypothetical protein